MKLSAVTLFVVGTLLRAQPLFSEQSAEGRPDWGRIRDSLEISVLGLKVLEADLLVEGTDFWHRLIPRITLAASFGIRGVTFIDASDPSPWPIPSDLYRLSLTLSVSDLIGTDKHERAHIMKEQAHLALALAQTRQHMDRQVLVERAGRLRSELSLLEEELRLAERILRYYSLLFEQGKTSFDGYIRAELQALAVRQRVQRLRAELIISSVN